MAASPPKLTSATVYLPSGRVKRFLAAEVAAWGVTPMGVPVLMVKGAADGRFTRYAGFPIAFEEEISAIQVAGPGELPL